MESRFLEPPQSETKIGLIKIDKIMNTTRAARRMTSRGGKTERGRPVAARNFAKQTPSNRRVSKYMEVVRTKIDVDQSIILNPLFNLG